MKNARRTELVTELKRLAIQKQRPLWKRIATDLEKSSRKQRIVNLWKLNQCDEGEILLVPGKILGDGSVNKKLTVAATAFSNEAKQKLAASGCKTLTIQELMKQEPDGKSVRIIG